MKEPPQKVAYLSRNSIVSEFFTYCLLTAQQPKWQKSCSKMRSIEQLYIELGFRPNCPTVVFLKLIILKSSLQYKLMVATKLQFKIEFQIRKGNHIFMPREGNDFSPNKFGIL